MNKRLNVKLTANFERNLADIERFLAEADAHHAFTELVEELLGTVVTNLEQFPGIGRPFFNRAIGSAEAAVSISALEKKLTAAGTTLSSLREYVMAQHLVLYVQVDDDVFLLAIKHHRQLSFDFEGQWEGRR
jgi:plasmid stabilization system protein ParE